jgi:hypothetical protein
MHQTHRTRRTGFSLVWGAVYLIAFAAFCSLAVDFGRVQLAKTELLKATEAAARAAAADLANGTTSATNTAISVAAQNSVDGTPLVLQAGDIQCGYYDSTTNTFTTSTATYNAVKINAKRIKSRGTGVSLTWGKVIGADNCDVTASAMATYSSKIPYGIIGYTSITVNKNMFAASYDSTVTTNPSTSVYYTNCLLESNGAIADTNNGDQVKGTIAYGPSGSADPTIARTTTTVLSSNLVKPTMPTFTPVTNPGSIAANISGVHDVTYSMPGGTYYFTGINTGNNCVANFSGPAVVYMDGDWTQNDGTQWIAYNNDPNNLIIYVNSGNTVTFHNNSIIVARIVAPDAALVVNDTFELDGSMCFDTIKTHDNFRPFLDENLINASGNTSISLTQ